MEKSKGTGVVSAHFKKRLPSPFSIQFTRWTVPLSLIPETFGWASV